MKDLMLVLFFLLQLIAPMSYAGGDKTFEAHAQCVSSYVTGDFRKALKSCKKAQSNRASKQVSNYLLGEMYANGKGVNRDYSRSIGYYKESASAGYPPAQLVLAHHLFEYGNKKDALRWYLKAGSYKWDGAAYSLARSSDIFVELGEHMDAYKCLYAASIKGYQVDLKSLRKALSKNEIERADEEVAQWISNSEPGIPLVSGINGGKVD